MVATAQWLASHSARKREPCFVVEIAFDFANTDVYYFTSRRDAALPDGASVIHSVVTMTSIIQQTLNPDKARSQIGSIAFGLRDKGGAVSGLFASKFVSGESLKGRRVRVYRGYVGDDWDDYQPVTQVIKSADLKGFRWKIQCADIQREMRKHLFGLLAITQLSASISATDTTIPVTVTSKFRTLEHGTSYSHLPNQTVVYFEIEKETCACLAADIQPGQFTNVLRGVLNTQAVEHTLKDEATNENKIKVIERPYFELPAVKALYALLTGVIYGSSAIFPWNLGIDTAYVDLSSFTDIEKDLWDQNDDNAGVIFPFDDLKKEDGQKFIEEQILAPLGLFLRVNALGALELKRIEEPLPGVGYEAVIDQNRLVKTPTIKLDYAAIKNWIEARWNRDRNQKRFTRISTLLDANSINRHGISEKPVVMELRGVRGSQTSQTILHNRMNYFRDGYAGPVWRAVVPSRYLPDDVKIGSLVRLYWPDITDPYTGQPVDRVVRIDGASDNPRKGIVNYKVTGATEASTPLAANDAGDVVANAFWSKKGTDILTLPGINIVDEAGVKVLKADYTLVGGEDINAASSIFYCLYEFKVDVGVRLYGVNNVQFRAKFGAIVNGIVSTAGNGHAGGNGATGVVSTLYNGKTYWSGNGTPGANGIVGMSVPQYGMDNSYTGLIFSMKGVPSGVPFFTISHGRIPHFEISYDPINDDIVGIPSDWRGTSGGGGGPVVSRATSGIWSQYGPRNYHAPGGNGGKSGGGFLLVTPSLSFGYAGKIITDGEDGLPGGSAVVGGYTQYGGAGDGGSPGGFGCILTNTNAPIPDLSLGRFSAKLGACPYQGVPLFNTSMWGLDVSKRNNMSGFLPNKVGMYDENGNPIMADPNPDLFEGAKRVMYLPEYIAAADDPSTEVVTPPGNLIVDGGTAGLHEAADGTILAGALLSWTESTDPYRKGTRIRYKKSADTQWTDVSGTQSMGTNSYKVFPLETTNYDFQIYAVNRFGKASVLVTLSNQVVEGRTINPFSPAGITVTDGKGQVHIVLTQSNDKARNRFRIWEAVSNNRALANIVAEPDANTYDRILAVGATRYYWAQEIDNSEQPGGYLPVSATGGLTGTSLALDWDGDINRPPDSMLLPTVSFRNSFEDDDFGAWTATAGDTLVQNADAYSGLKSGLFTSTETAPASTAYTDGTYTEVPDYIALAFAGRRVRVTLYAKKPSSNAAIEFAVAYTANDTGNSGWITFTPTTSWAAYTFVYDVPVPLSGGTDVIGIWADTSGAGKGVLIDNVVVEIVTAEEELNALQLVNGPADPGATEGADWDLDLYGRPSDAQLMNQLFDPSTWGSGTFPPAGFASQGYGAIVDEVGPHGNVAYIWKQTSTGSGNLSMSPYSLAIDPLQTYRFSVWIKRGVGVSGSFLFAIDGSQVDPLDAGNPGANYPYFFNDDWATSVLELDKWYLLVGYLYPSNHTGTTSYGAVYDGVTGEKVVSLTDLKSKSTVTQQKLTVVDLNVSYGGIVRRARPRMDTVDGTEPGIEALLPASALVTKTSIETGLDLVVGYLRRGSDIVLDFANRAISVANETFGAAGIQIQWNSGAPRFYVGDGFRKFFKYSGTQVELGPDVQFPGADTYANSTIYWHSEFESFDSFFQYPSGAGAAVRRSYPTQVVELYGGTTLAGYALLRKYWLSMLRVFYLTVNTRMKIKIDTWGAVVADRHAGSVSLGHIDYGMSVVWKDSNANLYFRVSNGGAYYEVSIPQPFLNGSYIIEIEYFVNDRVDFYLNSSLVATITKLAAGSAWVAAFSGGVIWEAYSYGSAIGSPRVLTFGEVILAQF